MMSNPDELLIAHTGHLHLAYHTPSYQAYISSVTPGNKALCTMSINRNLDLSKLMLQNNRTQVLEQLVITEDVQQHI